MILIQDYSCDSKYELKVRERFYIEQTKQEVQDKSVNRCIPTRTIKEWFEDNKDKVKEERKKYKEGI